MLDVLNFVRGAVSTKDHVMPVLTHFCIYGGRIQGANGRVAIDAPCPDLGFEAIVPADRFLRAVDTCKGEPNLKLTEKGRLVITKKPFRAMLPCHKVDTFPKVEASPGERHPVADGLLDTLRLMRPFVADDAERAWASTVLFDSAGNVFSTTNAMIGMTKCASLKALGRDVQLPVFAVDEILRLGRSPDSVSIDDAGITFHYGAAWLKASHISSEWPVSTAQKWLEMTAKYKKIPANLWDAIEQLLPFCPDPKYPVVLFKPGKLTTTVGESEAEIEGFDLGTAALHAENLKPMLAVATNMAITERAALFTGPNFKGVMSLLRY